MKRAASVKTGGSRAKSVGAKDRPALVDRRFESSRAVLLGVEAAIRAKGGPAAGEEIPASLYFAAIMAGLQSGVGTSTVELMYLLANAMPHVNPAVLRSLYAPTSELLLAALRDKGHDQEWFIAESALRCLGTLLHVVPPMAAEWDETKIAHLTALLAFAVDARPEIRTVAAGSLQVVLARHHEAKFEVAASHVAQFCLSVLKAATARETAQTVLLIEFLKAGLPLLPRQQTSAVVEALLRLAQLSVPRVTALMLSVVTHLLKSPIARLKPSLMRNLVSVLLERVPPLEETSSCVEFTALLATATVRAQSAEAAKPSAAVGAGAGAGSSAGAFGAIVSQLPAIVACLFNFFEAEQKEVHKAACASLTTIFFNCVSKDFVAACVGGRDTPLHQTILVVDTIVQYKYQRSWALSLPNLGVLFRMIGEHSFPLLAHLVSNLVELQRLLTPPVDTRVRLEELSDAAAAAFTRDQLVQQRIRALLGVALRSMGVARFLEVVPLHASTVPPPGGVAPGVDDDRLWLLRLLRQHVRYTRAPLAFFAGPILASAMQCEAASRAAESTGFLNAARSYSARAMLLWSLFPSFCVSPCDVPTAFNPQLGQLLTKAVADTRYPQLSSFICGGIKVLIQRNLIASGVVEDMQQLDVFVDADTVVTRPGASGGKAGGGRGGAGGASVVSGARKKQSGDFQSIFAESLGAGASALGESIDDAGMDADGEDGDDDGGAEGLRQTSHLPSISDEEAKANLATIATYAKNYLPVLFNLYEGLVASTDPSAANRQRRVLEAIGLFATIAPKDLVTAFFNRLFRMLVDSVNALAEDASGTPKVCGLLSLCLAMVSALTTEQAQTLYAAVTPLLADGSHATVQKRAYKVLTVLVRCHPVFVNSPEALDNLLLCIRSTQSQCSSGAKRARLALLLHITQALSIATIGHLNAIGNFMGDVLLCVKEASKRTRDAALDVLVGMAAKMLEGGEGSLDATVAASFSLGTFLKMILAAVTTETPHIRSAAVVCLGRVVYEYSGAEIVLRMLSEVMPSILLLFQSPDREVVKVAIMFLRVALATMESSAFEALLPSIMHSVFVSAGGETRNKLRSRTRVLIERIVQKFGADSIAALIPADDIPLLRHIRKQKRRADRRKNNGSQRKTHKDFEQLFGSDDQTEAEGLDEGGSDGDAGFDEMPRARATASAPYKRGRTSEADATAGGKAVSDDQVFVDLEALDAKEAEAALKHLQKPGSGRRDKGSVGGGTAASRGAKSRATGASASTAGHKSGRGGKDAGWGRGAGVAGAGGVGGLAEGSRFRNKKGGGDVRRKGDKFEPFAYLPLDARALSAKGSNKSVSRFKNVVRTKRDKGDLKRKRG